MKTRQGCLWAASIWSVISACTVERVDIGPLGEIGGQVVTSTPTSTSASTGDGTVTTSTDNPLTCVAFNDAGEVRDIACDASEQAVNAGFCVQYYFDGAAGHVVCPSPTRQWPTPSSCETSGRSSTGNCGETSPSTSSTVDILCTSTDDSGYAIAVPCTATGPVTSTTAASTGSTSDSTTHSGTTHSETTPSGTIHSGTTAEPCTSDDSCGSSTASSAVSASSGTIPSGTTMDGGYPRERTPPTSDDSSATVDRELVGDGGADAEADAGVITR